MRGVPDHSPEQPCLPSLSSAPPGSLTLKEPIPEELAALGEEVLDLVPRKERGSLEAYRRAAHALSRMLRTKGVRVKPKVLYYVALRVKWITDTTGN
jgi:hypothetical protein